MVMLLAASRIHSSEAANHKAGLKGMKSKPSEHSSAPHRKKGVRRPRGWVLRSLSAPTMGCTIKPVTGPANQSNGSSLPPAPSIW